MEIDREKLRELLLWLLDIIEKRENDLLAHEVTLVFLRSSVPEVDDLLRKARENPSPELAKRHKEIRETIEQLLAEQNPENALRTFLRKWKPNGPIH